MKEIASNTYNVSTSNKESGNELILENNTDHIDSKNEIVHELLDVEFEHLQRRYQHLLDQSSNQSKHTISNDQCSNETAVTKGYKVTESNAKNPELNKVIPPLKKVRSCEEQLTEVRKKHHDKYITFMPHCWRLSIGWNRRKSIINWKTQSQSKILPRCSYRQHVSLYEATTSEITGLHHFAHWNK